MQAHYFRVFWVILNSDWLQHVHSVRGVSKRKVKMQIMVSFWQLCSTIIAVTSILTVTNTEGNLLYLQIVSMRAAQITTAMHLLHYSINPYMI